MLSRQLISFGIVGGIGTIVFALLYVGFEQVVPGQVANFLALLLTAIANTAANRRFTFGVRGRSRVGRHHAQGILLFLVTWAGSAGSLAVLALVAPHSGPLAQVVVLTGANLVGTVIRFLAMRYWVFRVSFSTGMVREVRSS